MGEPQLGTAGRGHDVEHDLAAGPLTRLRDEGQVAVGDSPDHAAARLELDHALEAVVLRGVPVGELGTHLVGTPLDLARPPGADVHDGGEELLR